MEFYLGAYYLIKLRDSSNLDEVRKYLYTTSTCINDSLLDGWALSWVENTNRDFTEASENFSITFEKIKEIQSWTDAKFNEGKIGWLNVFYDLETLKGYKNFFENLNEEIKILAIYFSEQEREHLLKEFQIEGRTVDAFGLETMLSKQIKETQEGKTIGYDLIGVELSGDFHSFYCHDMAEELKNKFNLKVNEYGLFENYSNWSKVTDYMNDEETGCKPVPWFYVKVKLFDNE